MKILITILSISLLLFTSCRKSNDRLTAGINCEALKTGLSTDDEGMIAHEINAAAADLIPLPPTPSDQYGQAHNINTLVQRLSAKCGLHVTLLCYSCIKTLPAQSEIRITFTENGTTYDRVLDISTDQQHRLIFHAMHE